MLCAAVAVSASAGIKGTKINSKVISTPRTIEKKALFTRGGETITNSVPMKNESWGAKFSMNRGTTVWDFEDEAQIADWTFIDNDGDGNNWTYQNNSTAEKKLTTHSGDGVMYSESFSNSLNAALTPDNWMITPVVTLEGNLTFYAAAQDASYSDEVFAVYVCIGTPNGIDSFTKISDDITATSTMTEYTFDLSEYAGQQGCIAIRHYNVTDMFILLVDDVMIGESIPDPTISNLVVTPATTSAEAAWDAENATSYILAYRPYVDISGNPINTTLSMDNYQQEMDDWYIYDGDGDGDSWTLFYSDTTKTDLCFGSASIDLETYSGLTPDNWLYTRDLKLQGELRFTMWGASDDYPDKMNVYAMVYNENDTSMVQLFDEDLVATTTPTEYTYDLSTLNGEKGFIIFRHYNSDDMTILFLDNIFIGDPNAEIIDEPEWQYVTELTEPNCSLTGLDPNTEYEVMVQAYNELGASSEILYTTFWTLDGAPDVFILGEVNDQNWAANAGIQMNYVEETGLYTLEVNFDGRNDGYNYFGFTNKLGANADDWDNMANYRFGAVSDGDFWVTDEWIGQELSLTRDNGQAFRIPAGDYTLTVNLETMKLVIEKKSEPQPQILLGDVNDDGFVTIADATLLIDYLLGANVTINEDNSDVETNGTISIGDVTALIDMLLNAN